MVRAGANVGINYFSHQEDAEAVVNEVQQLGRKATFVQGDVADRAAATRMVEHTVENHGRLDIVVCNAAYSKREPFLEITEEGLRRTLGVSLFGAFYVAQAGARVMAEQGEGGCILFMSSVMAHLNAPLSTAYNTAKAGMNQMAKTIAAELLPHRIRVNVIEPGWIDTPGERKFATEREIREGAKTLPWKRLGTAEDIARMAAFLCSDAADYITGSIFRVDGGFCLFPQKIQSTGPNEP